MEELSSWGDSSESTNKTGMKHSRAIADLSKFLGSDDEDEKEDEERHYEAVPYETTEPDNVPHMTEDDPRPSVPAQEEENKTQPKSPLQRLNTGEVSSSDWSEPDDDFLPQGGGKTSSAPVPKSEEKQDQVVTVSPPLPTEQRVDEALTKEKSSTTTVTKKHRRELRRSGKEAIQSSSSSDDQEELRKRRRPPSRRRSSSSKIKKKQLIRNNSVNLEQRVVGALDDKKVSDMTNGQRDINTNKEMHEDKPTPKKRTIRINASQNKENSSKGGSESSQMKYEYAEPDTNIGQAFRVAPNQPEVSRSSSKNDHMIGEEVMGKMTFCYVLY